MLSVLFGITGCLKSKVGQMKQASESLALHNNAIYYWKTQFRLNDYDKQFLQKYHIQKLYLRMFDVDYAQDRDGVYKAIPIATTQFIDTIPTSIEVVPTIYITNKAIASDSAFAELLYNRVVAMMKRNKIHHVNEIQVDCDWTNRTQSSFFKFCKDLQEILHKDNHLLSATIRLHQLRGKTPPVDKGVLMLYNTGSIYSPDTENSILSYKDVAPYLKSKVQYALPLDYAFPTYSWGIWMRNDKFQAILHRIDVADSSKYKLLERGKFSVVKEHYLENHHLLKGDIVRLETSNSDEIRRVKKLVLSAIKQDFCNKIIYHLDSVNLSKYKEEEINQIYN